MLSLSLRSLLIFLYHDYFISEDSYWTDAINSIAIITSRMNAPATLVYELLA
jgi:hypothetical protein